MRARLNLVRLPVWRAEDVDNFGKKKSRFQLLSQNNARSAFTSMQSILKRRVYVSAERGAFLLKLREGLAASDAAAGAGAEEGTGESVKREEGEKEDKADGSGEGRIPMLLIDFTDEQARCRCLCRRDPRDPQASRAHVPRTYAAAPTSALRTQQCACALQQRSGYILATSV